MVETPGGVPKVGQTAEETARRELLEETGYAAKRVIDLKMQPWMDAAAHDLRFFAFVGLDCTKVAEPLPDRTEVLETVLIPLDDWYDRIWRGEIFDNKIIGLSLLVIPALGGRLTFES